LVTKRDIFVFGHDQKDNVVYKHDSDQKIEIPDEHTLQQYLQSTLFKDCRGHYIRGGSLKLARIAVCTFNGKAYGHLVIERNVMPPEEEKEKKTAGKQEHMVKHLEWYEKPVNLTQLDIRDIKNEPNISHEQFEKIKKLAGKITIFK
jgi:hypothetical protein